MVWMNVYYSPEAFGLETVGEVSWSEPCYDFDLTVVWKDKEGNFLWASDSGCSCPSPFEDHSLETLEKGTAHQAAAVLQSLLAERSYDKEYAEPQVVELVSRLMSA